MSRCARGSPKNSFAVFLAAPPTDLVSVEEVIVHYATVIVQPNPTELVSVESWLATAKAISVGNRPLH